MRSFLSRCTERLQSLGNRNYCLFAVANGISLIGTWMQRVGVGWLTWTLTHSNVWLGAIAFANLFPTVCISLFAGTLADRYDRQRIMLLTQCIALIQTILLAVLTSLHLVTAASIFGLTLGLGIADAMNQPARLSWIARLVGPLELPSATAINSISFNIARFIGPAVAGVLIVRWGIVTTLMMNALSYAVLIVVLCLIQVEKSEPRKTESSNLWRCMLAGYRYTRSHSQLAPTFLMLIWTALGVRGMPELAPAIADMAFRRGAAGFASLVTMIGLGALTGGVWMIGRDPAKDLIPLIIRHVLYLSIIVLCIAVCPDFLIALPLFFAVGFSLAVTGIGAQTLIQTRTADHMLGRVFALYGIVYRGGPAISALWMGMVSSYCGIRWTLCAGAMLCFGAWCWITYFNDRL